jgi:hypothetical protein
MSDTEEFDELAKRQGHWGGGYQAKRQMAANKMQEPVINPAPGYCKNCKDYTIEEPLYAQPAQEPPSEWASIKAILDEYGLQAIDFVAHFKAALAQPAQEPVAFDLFLESEDFYELMQTYRHCLTDALLPFEEVKDALRAAHIGSKP